MTYLRVGGSNSLGTAGAWCVRCTPRAGARAAHRLMTGTGPVSVAPGCKMLVGGVEGEGSRRPIVAMWMDIAIVSKRLTFHTGTGGKPGQAQAYVDKDKIRCLLGVRFSGVGWGWQSAEVPKPTRRGTVRQRARSRARLRRGCCHCDPTCIHDTRFPPAARFRGQTHLQSSTSRAGRSCLCLSFRWCGTAASHNGHASACGPSLSSACDRARA